MEDNHIVAGTVVLYTGDLTDKHGEYKVSWSYPTVKGIRYMLVTLSGYPALSGVSRESLTVND